MDKKLAIVICNCNRSDYVLKSLESAFASDFHYCDLTVADNASTDGSAEAISARFGNSSLRLIVNSENRGGSGDFNTGMDTTVKETMEVTENQGMNF